MFKKLDSILSGWKNVVFENEAVEILAKNRASVCASCPHAKKGKYETFKDNKIKEISGLICKKCSCPLVAKLRSQKETCPIKKW